MHSGRRSTPVATWTGGTEWAIVVDGPTRTPLPGTEARALTDKPLALRYRPGPRIHAPTTLRTDEYR